MVVLARLALHRALPLAVLALSWLLGPHRVAAQCIDCEGHAISVTPDGVSTPQRAAFTNGYSATFTVTNNETFREFLAIHCGGSSNVTCSGTNKASVTLDPGIGTPVNATYDVGALGNGTLTLTAINADANDVGSYAVPVVVPGVSVTPDAVAAPARPANSGPYTETFTVRNTGATSDTYTIVCSGSSNLSCIGTSAATVPLGGGLQTNVTATYSVTNGGTGNLTLSAQSQQFSTVSDLGSFAITVTPPPGAPIVSAAPYNYATQDYARCAHQCFGALYAQSTVPYFSLDAARQLTLAYNGDRLNPKPFVHVNVSPDPGYGGVPTEYQLQIRVNGASVTFVNGEPTLRFAYGGPATQRLGGQFDASSYTTGVYPIDINVSAVYPTTTVTSSVNSKLVVVNETNAAVAKAWTLAGIQRLYVASDGSALITGGEGSAVFFQKSSGVDPFLTPTGEFSKLIVGTPSGAPGRTRLFADSTKVVFDNAGRMVEVRDRFGNAATVVYDGSGRVSQIKDPLTLALTLTYNANGLASVADPMGRTTVVTVDASRRLTAIKDPDNVSTRFDYDATSRLSTITNRSGHTTTLGYDAQSGKLASVTQPAILLFDGTTAAPVATFTAWQKVGVPYGSTAMPVAAPRADTVYSRVTDPGGHVTRFSMNAWGAPVEVSDPLGGVTTVTYDGNGLPIRTAAPSGAVDTAAYNPSGLPVYAAAAGRTATNMRYAAYAQPDSIWGEGQQTVRNYIGANGRVDSTRLGDQTTVTKLLYDGRGRVVRTTDAQGHLLSRTSYAGAHENRSRDSLPGGRVTIHYYDDFGRDTATAGAGGARRVRYDPVNRPVEVYDAVNPSPTVTTYDSLYVRSVTDPKGQVYGFAYNALGWLTQQTDPAGRAQVYAYGRDGELKRWTNRRGDTLVYVYDALHHRTSKTGSNTAAETWGFSPDRRTITGTAAASSETAYLNVAGQPDSVRTAMAGQTYWRRYAYTAAGLLDSMTASGGGITFLARKYAYNTGLGTLASIRLGTQTTNIATNSDLQPILVTYPGSDVVDRQFYTLHGLASQSSSAPYGQGITRFLSYDAATRLSRQIDGTGAWGRQYTYDGLGRLLSDSVIRNVSNPCSGTPPPVIDDNGNECTYSAIWQGVSGQSFAYDAVGNRTDQDGSYTTGNRISGFAGCSYLTDNDGNVTSRTCGSEIVTFTWTAESRLASVTVGGQTTAFQYDAAGWLVRKDLNGVPQRHFLWDGDNVLAELDGVGTAKVAEYSYSGLDRLHAVAVGTTPYYGHADGLGNVITLTDSAKAVKRTYSYDLWGQLSGGSDTRPFAGADRARFKGALWLGPELDLYYMRARWYEPKSGRFLTEDPIGLNGGINPYTYAHDDPVNFTDPTGTQECPLGTKPTQIAEWGTETFMVCTGGGRTVLINMDNYSGGMPSGEGGHPVSWGDQSRTGRSGAAPQQPSCRSATFPGSTGTISVQTNAVGYPSYGIYMHNIIFDYGIWWADVYVNGKPVDGFKQYYPPHGSLPPSLAKSGGIFSIEAEHVDLLGTRHVSGPNACIIP